VTKPLRIIALGGLGEVGMNCLLLESEQRLLMVDCGVTFPDHELGIDVIHPSFDYVLERADDLSGVVLTHGHEDHIGALPYLLRELEVDVPIFGPPYALALVKERLREHDLGRDPRLLATKPRERLDLGPFEVTPFRVTHSIPDSTGLVVRVDAGIVVHSGDFKIDPDPLDGERFDEDLLAQAGREGVRLLLSDSTNSESDGYAGSEQPVSAAIERVIAQARGRVVVGMFSSNVHRVGEVMRIARKHGRRVLMLGRSLRTHVRLGEDFGLLPYARELLLAEHEVERTQPSRLLVLATGSQGEPAAALHKLAAGTHPLLALEPGDEVILSSRIIPGREREVLATIDGLERRGVRVHTRRDDPALHVSGHACRDEQRRMLELVQPRGFIPVHGTFVHMSRHAALARAGGVTETLVVDDGKLVELDAAGMRVVSEVEVGRVHIQHGEEISAEVLRERAHMAEAGVVAVALTLDRAGDLRGAPELAVRGVVDPVELLDLAVVQNAKVAVARALGTLEHRADDDAVELAVARATRRVFRDALGFRPLVHVSIRRESA
jgi:ribonuclease J